MAEDHLPAITGKQLIRLLIRDGWEEKRKTNHGVALRKVFGGKAKTVVVPDRRASLVPNTLNRLLGPLQTAIGRGGLQDMIDKYGL